MPVSDLLSSADRVWEGKFRLPEETGGGGWGFLGHSRGFARFEKTPIPAVR
jgi:hypothetical protein